MNVEFSDITCVVSKGWREIGEGRTILHGVSGVFRTGQLTAILGPSGAGKSTLLNILSGFSPHAGKGTIRVNGMPLNQRLFHKSSRYITQEDQLPPFLTTIEAMRIAASLKLPVTTSPEAMEAIVKEKLSLLGLSETANTPTDKLSGGQKKRLSIALELINNPHIFFLDEPTSGLDDFSTKQTVKLLRTLAKGGRTIVCTIHTPSATLLNYFDSVYVLGQGRCVYQGCVKNLLPFLSSAGFRCPTYHNPADYIIEVVDNSEINISVLSKAMENGRISHTPSKEALNQLDYGFISETDERRISRQSSSDGSDDVFTDTDFFPSELDRVSPVSYCYPTNGWHQFLVLTRRMGKQVWRNKLAIQIQLTHSILCGLLVGIVFNGAGADAEQFFGHVKLCVGVVLYHTYTNLMLPILVFPSEFRVLKKEYFNRWYGIHPFYAAYCIVKLPGQIFYGMIFNTIIYSMTGLPQEMFRYSYFSFIGILTVLASDSLGLAIGTVCNETNGSVVGPALIAPFLGLSVYGLDFAKDLSWFTRVLTKLSFMRAGVIANMITFFGFDRPSLNCNEVYCHFKEPKKLLDFVDATNVPIWLELGVMMCFICFFRALSYGTLRFRIAGK